MTANRTVITSRPMMNTPTTGSDTPASTRATAERCTPGSAKSSPRWCWRSSPFLQSQAAASHLDHPIAAVDDGSLVGDDEHGDVEPGEQFGHLLLAGEVERAGGFVGDQGRAPTVVQAMPRASTHRCSWPPDSVCTGPVEQGAHPQLLGDGGGAVARPPTTRAAPARAGGSDRSPGAGARRRPDADASTHSTRDVGLVPSMRVCPAETLCRPRRHRISVDFPDPLDPTTATDSPAPTRSETESTARTVPKPAETVENSTSALAINEECPSCPPEIGKVGRTAEY